MIALLEDISNGILRQRKFESLEMDDYYQLFWKPNGEEIHGFLELTDYIYQTVVDNELTTLKRELKADQELGLNRIRGASENYEAVAPLVLVSGSS